VPPFVVTPGTWQSSTTRTVTVIWTPKRNYMPNQVAVSILPANSVGGPNINIDNLKFYAARATILDRRGRMRGKVLPVSARLTTAAANQIGDIFLSNHLSTPFKGTLQVKRGGIRLTRGGRTVHPAELLAATGEKINFAHRIDPDTGAHGRLGDIASVSYNDTTGEATVNIDNQRSRFEALLERLAVVTGQSRG
jgi:hypothetical protein